MDDKELNHASKGRPIGFSPINGAGKAMVKSRAAWSMPQELWDWLRSQPNQSEYLRLLIERDRNSKTK